MTRAQNWAVVLAGISVLMVVQSLGTTMHWGSIVQLVLGWLIGSVTGWALYRLGHPHENDLDRRFYAALDLFTLMENRIRDLEHALNDANVHIPHGRAEEERKESIRRGHRELFGEEYPNIGGRPYGLDGPDDY